MEEHLGGDEDTYVLVPVPGETDEHVAVFTDGSFTRWTPRSAVAVGQ